MEKTQLEVKDNMLSSFGFIFLYAILVVVALFLPLIAAPGLVETPDGGLKTIFIWIILAGTVLFMTLPFYLGIIRMKVWSEPKRKPSSKKEVMKELLKFNSDKYPVKVESNQKYDIITKVKLADAKWKGVLFKGGLDKDYTLYLKLDEKTKTAYCVEHTRSLNWDGGIGARTLSSKAGWNMFYGVILFESQKMKVYDPLQLFKNVADININIPEVKWQLFNIIVRNGWVIKPRILPFQVRK